MGHSIWPESNSLFVRTSIGTESPAEASAAAPVDRESSLERSTTPEEFATPFHDDACRTPIAEPEVPHW